MKQKKDSAISLPLQISTLAQGLVFAGVSILSFFVPFTLGHPQWLVGTIVNACLFLTAIYLPKKYFLPVVILPSLGVLSRGLIFGPFTLFLLYFLPFIWLGNLILILVFKRFVIARRSQPTKQSRVRAQNPWIATLVLLARNDTKYFFAILISAGAKFLFLFGTAFIFFKFSVVPAVFLQAMGLNQLATALAGGLISFLIYRIATLKN